ncbi:MAG: glycosyltransferase family 39 protein, partial [Anaerolineae bacterium]|nr:glycosyltransferase family 39 protein [Anaerolineae bacterium]
MTATLAAVPALLGVYGGLGLPWALVALPRQDWADRGTVLALGFGFGPLLLTAWMFVLGTIGAASDTPLLRLDWILAGVVILALAGATLAWRKSRLPFAHTEPDNPGLAFDEKLLIGLIAAALLLRLVSIAFWPFTAYDALWVFGYEGRLYTLLGTIPHAIDYYPQFMPLQYTFAQLAVGGLSDHAARAVILFTHLGSILAVYTLGKQTLSRRVGLFAAALWALYPHVGEWARFGDLEIPVTFLFTLSAAFFLRAWMKPEQRRRYALTAGLCLGGAMWTKPTAGALIWGVLLLLAVDLVRLRFDWRAWRPRFEVALIMGLACLPLGAVWYVRNGLLGHALIDLPTGFWLTQAARSGVEFGWPLLALLILFAYLYLGPVPQRPHLRGGLVGLALILAGLLPSILDPHRLGLLEWALLAVGAWLLWRAWWPLIRAESKPLPAAAIVVGWALLLALP